MTMKVVHISDSLMSGAPYRLAQIQRLGELEALALCGETTTNAGPRGRAYPYDLLFDAPESQLRPVLEGADLVHYHHRWDDSRLFYVHPWAWDVVKDKPSLIQFHIPRQDWMEDILGDRRVVKLVIAQQHVRWYPECIPVPNAVPIDDELHRPLAVCNDPPIIAFTPPDCQADGWWSKGCAETMEVLAGGYRHRIVTDRSWREAMEVRRNCDIAIDEVVTGGFHMCSLEALSQGLATIAGLDARTVDALEMVTGTRSHPWVVAGIDTLRQKLDELVSDADYLQAKRQEARAYMVQYWHPRVVLGKFLEIYAQVLERHA
jgi:hypothetical protein